MRAPGRTAVLLVVAVSAGACAAAVRAPSDRLAGPVVISATCTEEGVQATVKPWVARVGIGKDIEWRIDPSSGVDDVDISQINDWPFTGPPPRVRKGNPGKGTQMKPTVKENDKFQYNISFVCPDGRRLFIDPDIIIVNES